MGEHLDQLRSCRFETGRAEGARPPSWSCNSEVRVPTVMTSAVTGSNPVSFTFRGSSSVSEHQRKLEVARFDSCLPHFFRPRSSVQRAPDANREVGCLTQPAGTFPSLPLSVRQRAALAGHRRFDASGPAGVDVRPVHEGP